MKNVKKIFMEVVHNSNIDFPNNIQIISGISKNNNNRFPQVNMNLNENIIQMTGNANKNTLILDANRIIISFDERDDFQEVIKTFEEVLKGICLHLDIHKIMRIGIRTIRQIPCASEGEASSIIKGNFIKENGKVLDEFGVNIDNFHLGFSSVISNYKINHNIGIATNQEITIDQGQISRSITFAISCDIDFYTDVVTEVGELQGYFSKVLETVPKFMNKYQRMTGRG